MQVVQLVCEGVVARERLEKCPNTKGESGYFLWKRGPKKHVWYVVGVGAC